MKSFFGVFLILVIVQTAFSQQAGCVVLFSQCNYQGNSVQVCGSNPTVQDSLKNYIVKSVQIPEGNTITFYNKVNFQEQSVVLTSSVACLSTPLHLSFAQLKGSEQTSNYLNIRSAKVN